MKCNETVIKLLDDIDKNDKRYSVKDNFCVLVKFNVKHDGSPETYKDKLILIHYNTAICCVDYDFIHNRLYELGNPQVLNGAYSRTDCKAINAFMEYFGFTPNWHIHNGHIIRR